MFRGLSNFLLLAVALRSATAAIDFTPLVKEYTRQGMVYRQVTLKDDKADITFVPPQGWTVRGVSARLQLSPPHSNLAEATVEAASLPGPQPFDEKTTKVIEQQVVDSAPPGSQAVQVLKREQNPVLMNQNLSFEVVISYQVLGRTFCRSVLFVRTPDTELVFRFSAPKPDFDALNNDFRLSITSWQWIEAKAVKGSTGNPS